MQSGIGSAHVRVGKCEKWNRGCEKILRVSLSFWSNLKFFKMMFLAAKFCVSLPHRRSTKASLETNPLHKLSQISVPYSLLFLWVIDS